MRGRGKYISRDGKAYNPIRFNQPATIHTNPDGYPCFGGGIPVHLYVATAWVPGYFDGAEVDHIDYDRTNYSANNLRWVSHIDNIQHSVVDENHYANRHDGVKNGRATFTESQVELIRQLFADGHSTMEVVKFFHPEYTYEQRKRVWNKYDKIKTGETWKQ